MTIGQLIRTLEECPDSPEGVFFDAGEITYPIDAMGMEEDGLHLTYYINTGHSLLSRKDLMEALGRYPDRTAEVLFDTGLKGIYMVDEMTMKEGKIILTYTRYYDFYHFE